MNARFLSSISFRCRQGRPRSSASSTVIGCWLGLILVLQGLTACVTVLPPSEQTCRLRFTPPKLEATFSTSGIKAAFVALPNEAKRESTADDQQRLEFRIAKDSSSEIDPIGYSEAQLFDRFGEALRRDMEAAARASGIQMTGPFRQRSELVFSQKDSLDFVIIPADIPEKFEMELEAVEAGFLASSGSSSGSSGSGSSQTASQLLEALLKPKSSQPSGDVFVRIKGRVRVPASAALWVVEPLSGEKLMVEPLASASEFVPFAPQRMVRGRKVGDILLLSKASLDMLNDDPEVARIRCELLNQQYQLSVSNLMRVLDPKALKTLLPQARSLKAKVVYTTEGVTLAR